MNVYKPNWKEDDQYKILYHDLKVRPKSGLLYIENVSELIRVHGIKSVWDYGCGINYIMVRGIKKMFPEISVSGYDPVFKENTKFTHNYITDEPVDMIVSTDCLEHLWENELETCFGYWKKKNPKYIFVSTFNKIAIKNLPNGTNAHKIVQPVDWWKNTLLKNFPNYKISNKYSKNINDTRDVIFLKRKIK